LLIPASAYVTYGTIVACEGKRINGSHIANGTIVKVVENIFHYHLSFIARHYQETDCITCFAYFRAAITAIVVTYYFISTRQLATITFITSCTYAGAFVASTTI
jgi:hypothetical protein